MNPIVMPLIQPDNLNLKLELAKQAGAILYLDARLADKKGVPSNSPLNPTWHDLTDNNNNATPTNFAGTIASGVDVSDPSKANWSLDGTDDYFTLASSPSINILTPPLAIFSTFKVNAGSASKYLICKNLDSASNIQFAILWDSGSVGNANSIRCYLNSTGHSSPIDSVPVNAWVNAGYIWDGNLCKIYVNGQEVASIAFTTNPLTTRANMRIGNRAAAASHFDGKVGTSSIYSGLQATVYNVLKSEKEIAKSYVGW